MKPKKDNTRADRQKAFRARVKYKLNVDGWSSIEKFMVAYEKGEAEIVRTGKGKSKKAKR
jgi:hypothetical protein